EVEKQIDVLEDEIVELQKEINELEIEIEMRNEIIKDRISSYQANGGGVQLLEDFYGVKDFNDFVSRVSAVVTLTNADTEIMEKQKKEKKKGEEKQYSIEQKIGEQEEMKDEIKAIIETREEQKESLEQDRTKQKQIEKKLKNKLSKLKLKDEDLALIEASLTAPVSFSAQNNGPSNGSKESSPKVQSVAYNGTGGSALAAGVHYIGKSRYAFGVKNPSSGLFDCSGFVQWAYEQEGINLPRSTSG